jgi:hypothetical protein
LSQAAVAQEAITDAAGPGEVPPEIAAMLGGMDGGTTAIAAPASEEPAAPGASAAGSNYLYSTLRVVNNGNPRGCGYADWNCLSNLCRADLGSTAWRGWAGCWRDGNNYICYFECGQSRAAF